MSRRKQTGMLDDVYGMAAALPWWAGVALALVAYAVLNRYAAADVPPMAAPGEMGRMALAQMVKGLSTYGQYIMPLALLVGALASWLARCERQAVTRSRSIAASQSADMLRQMTWQDFENVVGGVFRLRGYAVAGTGDAGTDGGIDLRLRKGSELAFVLCKHWLAIKVPVTAVQELYGVMAAEGAAQGFVVTSGLFTADARAFASARNIELIDGPAFAEMIERTRVAAPKRVTAKPAPAAKTPVRTTTPPRLAAVPQGSTPVCPRCGGIMIRRIAKQGGHAGKPFWGCARFPDCLGVRGLKTVVTDD
ncbi:restriction endonuclease [Cupriavidus necator]|nr:hypothetical protein N234_00125 [Ralstonia pickettii DTP0602]